MGEVITLTDRTGALGGTRVDIAAYPTSGDRMLFRVMLWNGMELIESQKFTAQSKTAICTCTLAIQHGCPIIASLEAAPIFQRKH